MKILRYVRSLLIVAGGLWLFLRGAAHRSEDGVHDQRDGFDSVVIARNADGELIRIGIAVADTVDRDTQFLGLQNGNVVTYRIDDEDGIRLVRHRRHASEGDIQLRQFLAESHLFLLRVLLDFAGLERPLEIEIVLQTLLDGAPVRQESRNPLLRDDRLAQRCMEHLDERSALLLRGDEEDTLSLLLHFAQCVADALQAVFGLFHIEDMDAFADAVEVLSHLRVPAVLRVTEVAGCLHEFFLGREGHSGGK